MGKHAQADRFVERAIALNPNDPKILCQKCELLIWKDRPGEGLQWLQAAKRRDPIMEEPWWRFSGRAYFELKNADLAQEALGRIRHMRLIDRACLAASFAYLGRSAEAKLGAANITQLAREFDVVKFLKSQPYLSQESRDHLAEGLGKTGM